MLRESAIFKVVAVMGKENPVIAECEGQYLFVTTTSKAHLCDVLRVPTGPTKEIRHIDTYALVHEKPSPLPKLIAKSRRLVTIW